MAQAGALAAVINTVDGFTNKSLRGLVAGMLGADYSANQMSYDLRRLRLHGLVARIPHTNTYTLTPEGQRVAIFYTKLADRLLRRLLEADQPPAPPALRRVLTVTRHQPRRSTPTSPVPALHSPPDPYHNRSTQSQTPKLGTMSRVEAPPEGLVG